MASRQNAHHRSRPRAGRPFRARASPYLSQTAVQSRAWPRFEHTLESVAALHRVAARDPEVHELLVAVHHLARPHDALHDPDLVDRVRAEMAAASPIAELTALAA